MSSQSPQSPQSINSSPFISNNNFYNEWNSEDSDDSQSITDINSSNSSKIDDNDIHQEKKENNNQDNQNNQDNEENQEINLLTTEIEIFIGKLKNHNITKISGFPNQFDLKLIMKNIKQTNHCNAFIDKNNSIILYGNHRNTIYQFVKNMGFINISVHGI